MNESCRFGRCVPILLTSVSLILLSSCATSSNHSARLDPVRKVDFKLAPNNPELAARARQIGNRLYPQVCALLDDGGSEFPPQFNIYLKKRLHRGVLGETRLNHIYLNNAQIERLEKQPGYLDDVLVHEMAHVAQHYSHPIIGRWLVFTSDPPRFWVEGIADYVCFKICITNEWHCPKCNSIYPHYKNGYTCAGAFLLFLEQKYNPRIVPQLNRVLRTGDYAEQFFLERTGKDLRSLWDEFRGTPAFTSNAVAMLKLQEELGFIDGELPKNIDKRLDQLLEARNDPQLKKLLAGVQVTGLNKKDPQGRLTLLQYFTQPGGSAESYLITLQQKKELPGFTKGEHGSLTGFAQHQDMDPVFPAVRTFTASKQGDDSVYHYTVSRESLDTAWTLQRAWRTNADGTPLEEYPLP